MAKFSFRGMARTQSPKLRRTIALSRAALIAERAARAFWPFLSVLLGGIGLALLGLFEQLPGYWHLAAAISLGLALAVSLVLGLWDFRLPDERTARARLDLSTPDRPLATLDDNLASGRDDPWARAVWYTHQRRAEEAAERLRSEKPDLRLAPFDVWAMRLFAPVLLFGGLIAAGPDWEEKLTAIFRAPPPAAAGEAAYLRLPMAEAWAVPPAYTGKTTVYLGADPAAPGGPATADLTLPQGSQLTIRVTDLDEAPALSAEGMTGSDAFTQLGGGLAEARGVLQSSGRIVVSGGGETLADWAITVTPDAPPSIEMPQKPVVALTGALEVFFRARDDYGVVSAWAEITPPGGVEEGKGLALDPINFALPLPITGDPREVSDSTMQDFGAHPWAGGKVEITLYAEDGAGQTAQSGPHLITLPGRRFSNPLARALVEQRRELALDFGQGERVLDVLQAVTRRPQEVFGTKHGAFLGTRTAIRRLAVGVAEDSVAEDAEDVIEFLWRAALSLEGGDLSNALERLRTAQERLRDALENGTEEDIRAAIDELRAAIEEYLSEMVRQALEQGLDPSQQQQQQQGQQGNELTQQDLNEMLNELQRRAEGGLRDQARELLSQLSRMLENLQMGQMQQGQQQGGPGQQAMQELQELIQRQRDLSDRTFGEARRNRREGMQGQQPGQGQEGQQGEGQFGQGQQPGQQPGQGQNGEGMQPGQGGQNGQGGLAGEQEQLRRMLEDLARQVPGGQGTEDIRRALEEAGRAMGEARDDLQGGAPGDAVEDQMEALDRLNEGANALAEAMQQNGQGDMRALGDGRGRGEGRDNQRADPFDRPAGTYGSIDGRDTGVPDRSVLDRAREVLEELRRRAGDPTRPELELDYLDRLMDQF